MKNIAKLFMISACAGTLSLSSCIEEITPTDIVTEEMLGSSDKAVEAMVWAMPAYFNALGSYDFAWGYGSLMHIRDVMTADMAVKSSGYNWYAYWAENSYLGEDYIFSQYSWNYYCGAFNRANEAIKKLQGNTEGTKAGYLGAAYAFRAFFYLDAARSYEFLPNKAVSSKNANGVDVLYMTLPIITEATTVAEGQNNPRVDHETMYQFILNDLSKAEDLIVEYRRPSKTLPSLACVYGLKARLFMWHAGYLEETGETDAAQAMYALAEQAARDAIDCGENTPTTQGEWLSTTTGFNSLGTNSWMWGASVGTDDAVVQSGILNWTSWMSNEATFGYASAGPYIMIGSDLYDNINDQDFRKLTFKAPKNSALEGKEPFIITDPSSKDYMIEKLPDYSSIKFRPGNGVINEYKAGASCDFPVMRIEEMYFIEAEAAAHQDAARGRDLLNDFMITHRFKNYYCKATTAEGIIDEIFLQKRIEFFGEGITFFDYKRLNKPVDRTTSNNWDPTENFNTGDGRAAWMNFVIPRTETNNNKGISNKNNPDASDVYVPVQ